MPTKAEINFMNAANMWLSGNAGPCSCGSYERTVFPNPIRIPAQQLDDPQPAAGAILMRIPDASDEAKLRGRPPGTFDVVAVSCPKCARVTFYNANIIGIDRR
jgi:hypothetical protein